MVSQLAKLPHKPMVDDYVDTVRPLLKIDIAVDDKDDLRWLALHHTIKNERPRDRAGTPKVYYRSNASG